jgi:hypothetical protein
VDPSSLSDGDIVAFSLPRQRFAMVGIIELGVNVAFRYVLRVSNGVVYAIPLDMVIIHDRLVFP